MVYSKLLPQWLCDSFRAHQICFRPGLCPGPAGEFTAPPDSLAGLREATSKGGKEGEKETGSGTGKDGKGKEGKKGENPFRKFLDPPLVDMGLRLNPLTRSNTSGWHP